MSTKFVSKNSQLMMVLKPGIPGSILTGQQPQPGIYVRFKDGFIDVKDEKIADMMRKSPAFGSDFIEVDEKELDPFKEVREEIEPIHKSTEFKYGHVESVKLSRPKKLPAELRKLVELEAKKMAREMLPGLVKETLKGIATEIEAKKSVGRPKKVEEPVKEGTDDVKGIPEKKE